MKTNVEILKDMATVSWSAMDGAESYIVYKKQSNGKYKKLASTKKTKITFKTSKRGTTYDLMIKAIYEDGTKSTIKNGKISFKS